MLNEEGRGTEVVDREIKEALDLLVVEVHCKEMGHSCLGQHGRHQLCSDAATSAHLALLAVGQVWHHTCEGGRREQGAEREGEERNGEGGERGRE